MTIDDCWQCFMETGNTLYYCDTVDDVRVMAQIAWDDVALNDEICFYTNFYSDEAPRTKVEEPVGVEWYEY